MSLFKKIFGKKQKHEVVNEEQKLEKVLTEEVQEETQKEVQEEQEAEEKIQVETEQEFKEDQQEVKEEIEQGFKDKVKEEAKEEIEQEVKEEAKEKIEQEVKEEVQVEIEEQPEKKAQEEAEEEIQKEESTSKNEKSGFIKKLFKGLTKTRESILKGVDNVLFNFKKIDEELYEELEEALIMADFGVDTTLNIMEQLKKKVKQDKLSDPAELKHVLQHIITDILTNHPVEDSIEEGVPTVMLIIGVNGVGKTTSIGKLSHMFKSQHKKVLVAAADTFRAAAIEQLNIWTERAGVEIIKHEEGSDAAAVVFDAIQAAKSRKSDILICDTAGRLQNKTNLMKELEKISRIIKREYGEAKQEILIVIDATTGQNAIQQVKLFKEVADINGIILTKLDGTAKGGAIVGIYEQLQVPVKYIGVGEKINDLQPFDAEVFAKALFNSAE